MIRKVGLFLLVVSISASAQETIRFQGPKSATKEDLQACSVALLKRGKARGLKGLTGKVLDGEETPVLELISSAKLPAASLEIVARLSRVAGKEASLRMGRDRTPDEIRDGVGPGPWLEPSRDKAPKGLKWFHCTNPDFTESATGEGAGRIGATRMLEEQPAIPFSDFGTAGVSKVDGKECCTWILPPATSKRFYDLTNPDPKAPKLMSWWDTAFVYDGVALVTDFRVTTCEGKKRLERAVVTCPLELGKDVDAIFRSPMPFVLEVVAETK
ncbi:MAG: hypothetical protein AAB074_11455 [Planctomycetota bacterium]